MSNPQVNSKTKITITLDTETYLRVKTSDINASALVNEFFKGYFKYAAESEEVKIIEELEQESEQQRIKSAVLLAKASNMRKQREENIKERMDKQVRISQTVKDSRVLDFD